MIHQTKEGDGCSTCETKVPLLNSTIEELRDLNRKEAQENQANHDKELSTLKKKLQDAEADIAIKSSRIAVVTAESMRYSTKCKMLEEKARNTSDASLCRIGELENQISELSLKLDNKNEKPESLALINDLTSKLDMAQHEVLVSVFTCFVITQCRV